MASDEVDIANDYWEDYTQQQIQRQLKNTVDFGTTHCVECGEEIEKERREAVTTNLCISCKEELEHREKQYKY